MPGILVGYARTSTCDQQAGLDAQIRDLRLPGARKSSRSRCPPWHNAIGSRKPCASFAGGIPGRDLQAGPPCQEHHGPPADRG